MNEKWTKYCCKAQAEHVTKYGYMKIISMDNDACPFGNHIVGVQFGFINEVES